MIPAGVRAALAQARLAIARAREKDAPKKDRAELLERTDAWRDATYESEDSP